VKRLRNLQGAARRKTKAPVGLTLQAGQVIERRRGLGRWFAFFADDSRPAETSIADRLGAAQLPNPLRLQVGVALFVPGETLVEPAPGIGACLRVERSVDFPVVLRNKSFDPFLALDDDGERRRLHAANGREMKSSRLRV